MSCKVQEKRQGEIAIAVDVFLESADELIADDNEKRLFHRYFPFFFPLSYGRMAVGEKTAQTPARRSRVCLRFSRKSVRNPSASGVPFGSRRIIQIPNRT
jgi:hypothetical protein